jgi:hypothetical protein
MVREQGQDRGLLAPGGGGTRVLSGVEHGLEHGRVLGAVGAEAELAGDVDRADRGGGPDPLIARGRREDVAAGRADAERADAARVGLGPGGQARDGRLEVLDPVGRVFKAAGFAAAFPLVGGVEREGDESPLGQPPGVQAGRLLLDPAAGVPDDDAGAGAAGGVVR